MFKHGDTVAWHSQAGGSKTEKVGTVVALRSDDDMRSPSLYAKTRFPGHRLKFSGHAWQPGGVLVEVKESAHAKAKLYMPPPLKLTLVETADELG